MPRKNILFLITKATSGGAQKYVSDIARNLPKNEFDIIVAYGIPGKLSQDLAAAGIKLRELRSLQRDVALISDLNSFSEILAMLRELRPDIIHLNSSKAAAFGVLAARLTGVPKIIFTVHGWPFKEHRNVILRALIYLISWLTAFLSHETVVVSRGDEKLGTHMWGLQKKIHYIPLGIAPFQTRSPDEGFRAMFGPLAPAKLRSSTLRLVTIGELTANKGLRYAIDAVAKLSERGIDAVYVIVSEGEEHAALQEYARKRGVSDRVFLPGFVPEAARNLSGFDVFVLPSLKEGTPYVLLEAAFVGIPIVATSVIDAEFMRSFPNARLVPLQDSEALADAIIEVSKLPRAARERATISSISEMVQKTVDLYLPAGRQVA